MPSEKLAVKAEGLTKRFRNLTAVDHIDFEINTGECFGMLGPNGAGKTTTVRMIYCFSPVTEGRLLIFGLDVEKSPRRIKVQLGVCPQESNLDPDFSIEKNLRVYARYFGIKKSVYSERIETLLDFAELKARRKEIVDKLSGGMKRRLLLARSLVNKPSLLILDEPTTGLDPQARHMIWDRIRELKNEGVTIILTTHYMEEASYLCDRLFFIDQGKIIDVGSPSELVDRYTGKDALEIWDIDDKKSELLQKSALNFEFSGRRAYLFGNNIQQEFNNLKKENFTLEKYVIRPANLEDVFLKLTGRGLRE